MNRSEARNQLAEILSEQKTVSTSRLSKLMAALNVDELVRINTEQAKKITRQKERLRKYEMRSGK
ncbi:hypothetical protein [Alkalihalophilus marmarensis]|uniref:Uncharacterized protein n=1 Tax=Alkalihalophilus marmarensis DSM 21297 TaxID=1188261 RepID=U6SMP8_9BACI|nr:hypothetical protein [Alkalihalophilus marmarensis]ERN52848.1 hypothetical protein A33I_14245 [Alkalihalophilus marmarensis DSM 21297]